MEGVPLKIPQDVSQDVKGHTEVIVPDYLTILQETEYEFSVENWVLTGLQSGFSSQQQTQPPSSSSGLQPSCPPYWMMFSSPQQSRLASRHSSDFWEPNPRQRSHSLNLAVLRNKFTISDSEDEGGSGTQKAQTCAIEAGRLDGEFSACQRGQRKAQKAFVPDLLNIPACLSSLPHQRRKNLRQCSLSVLEVSTKQNANADTQDQSPTSVRTSHTRSPESRTTSTRVPKTRANTLNSFPGINKHNTTQTCITPVTSLPSSGSDSSTELLSALSVEERELLGAITAQGYSLRTAIIALQKTGRQTPDQILSYLLACDHLCDLGYDMAQVEEALEMFQNCEAKAEEFLHLLSQFNEMGFQQNTIKEVLLVHENHQERALEELMSRVA
ncbi:hypothetical protein Q5P01_006087 [Channa striata]|uniref:UBA domain-containing protein n=1 Tax=Channa striata TaxID=64152 RepID=A0AA88SVS0_CHASR|nr:hypothetical protein Q5P01_006087 [Channa striata]